MVRLVPSDRKFSVGNLLFNKRPCVYFPGNVVRRAYMFPGGHPTGKVKTINVLTRNSKYRTTKAPARKRAFNGGFVPASRGIDSFVIDSLHELVDRLTRDARLVKNSVIYPNKNVIIWILNRRSRQP